MNKIIGKGGWQSNQTEKRVVQREKIERISIPAHTVGRCQSYFDNDNLAIKSILDIIVPYICIDDATRYCDNFYLSQHDMNEFSELYIVKKSCIKAWAAAHRELDFARAII